MRRHRRGASGFSADFHQNGHRRCRDRRLAWGQKTIESVGPALAICVYHRFSDLWEIPCLIYSMRPDYRYYLRNYNYLGLETVLYALRSPD